MIVFVNAKKNKRTTKASKQATKEVIQFKQNLKHTEKYYKTLEAAERRAKLLLPKKLKRTLVNRLI